MITYNRSGNVMVDLVVQKLLTEDPNERLAATQASILLCLLYYNFPLEWYTNKSQITLIELNKYVFTEYQIIFNQIKQ